MVLICFFFVLFSLASTKVMFLGIGCTHLGYRVSIITGKIAKNCKFSLFLRLKCLLQLLLHLTGVFFSYNQHTNTKVELLGTGYPYCRYRVSFITGKLAKIVKFSVYSWLKDPLQLWLDQNWGFFMFPCPYIL